MNYLCNQWGAVFNLSEHISTQFLIYSERKCLYLLLSEMLYTGRISPAPISPEHVFVCAL